MSHNCSELSILVFFSGLFENDKKFQYGDILKAAGWNSPARNAARGNVMEGGYTVQWTGPLYLK